MSIDKFDVLIVGAGGAGMMCALHAGQRGRKVALLDHANKIGRKILISGGGRCNFTNIHTNAESFVSNNPHFCKSALSRYTPDDFITLVKKHRIPYFEKKLGQLFCKQSAQNIVDMLVTECRRASAEFKLGCAIHDITKASCFQIRTSLGTFAADSVVIATGGLSIPQIGATGFGYGIAKQFGLNVLATAPALVGLDFTATDRTHYSELTGVSLDTIVTCNRTSFRENILFTHTGLSGPAILQASLYWQPGASLAIDLQPEFDVQTWLQEKRSSPAQVSKILAERLPKRFADRLCEVYSLAKPINQLSEKQLAQLSALLHAFSITPGGTVGYKKAEVTRGGVDTGELSSKTMEAKNVPGLYFIGEVVDVTGWLGGYNFQWAWSSGYVAAQYV